VILSVRVGADGRPESVTVSRSSGFPRLDNAAVEAVRRWRFKPAMLNGSPVSSTATVPHRFEL
jgi:protein TonB